jgi:repressor LexA
MQLGKKIKALRESFSLTQTDLANKTGLHRSQLSSLENENMPPFQDFTKYKLLSDILKTDPHELWEIGQQDRQEWKAKQHLTKAKILKSDISEKLTRPIPILSEIPADTPKDVTDQGYPPGIAEDYYEFKVDDPNAFFLRAQGDCMSPEIKNGDLLLVSPSNNVENGDIAVIKNKKGEKEVRRVTFQPDQVILTAENPTYPVIIWRKEDEPKIIGRVKEIIRRR